jgi:hypothetical protein
MSKRKKEKQDTEDKVIKSRKSDTNLPQATIPEDEREFVLDVKRLLRNQATLLSGMFNIYEEGC